MTITDVAVVATAVFALFALIAAVWATKYARDSVRAARDTVKPLNDMAARLSESVSALSRLLESNQTIVGDLASVLTVAQRMRIEDRLTLRLAQYERVMFAVQRMWEGFRRVGQGLPPAYLLEAQGDLRAALASLPPSELPESRAAAGQTITNAAGEQLAASTREIQGIVFRVHQDLERHLKDSG